MKLLKIKIWYLEVFMRMLNNVNRNIDVGYFLK